MIVYFAVILISFLNVNGEFPLQSSRRDFTLAVYEYATTSNPNVNLEQYRHATAAAKAQDADIIVFPEIGLLPATLRNSGFAEPIPDPKTTPCNPCQQAREMTDSPYLVALSCLAKENSIYMSVNLIEKVICNSTESSCPKDGQFHYNANAVFDPTGALIARYRKRFLFFEHNTDRPSKPESIVFETPFGRFGLIICFDTIFREAVDLVETLNPDFVLISTYWFDELPYLSANQYFYSWALGNGVDVAASNVHKPRVGAIGSMISSDGKLAYMHYESPESRLLLSRISQRNNSFQILDSITPNDRGIQGSPTAYRYTIKNFVNFTLVQLTLNDSAFQTCSNNLCCKLTYSTKSLKDDYYFGVNSNITSIRNHYFFAEEVCVLFVCSTMVNQECKVLPIKTETVFDKVVIEGNFTTKYVYPSVLGSEMLIVPQSKWQYSKGIGKIQTGSEVNVPLVSVSLFGRVYDQDPPYKP